MPKILLLRASDELKARVMPELVGAGYDAVASSGADVQTVLQYEPDLILLETDVATLDCCGLIVQLKGNESTARIKIVLLAHGGWMERRRGIALGAEHW